MAQPRNILIIRLSSLGDVLMGVPAVKALRERFPDAHISWLAEGSVTGILAHQDFIDEVIFFPRAALTRHLKSGHLATTAYILHDFVKSLRKREYDCIIDLHGIAKSVALMMIARGGRRIGFCKTFAKDMSHIFYGEQVKGLEKRIHKVERNMLAARYLGCEDPPADAPLLVNDSARTYVDDFLRSHDISPPIIAVNPFASKDSAFKRWPLERYADLIGMIRQERMGSVIVIWGPGEREEAQRLAAMVGDGARLACKTDIAQLYALLARSSVYIGGDTGTTHLASAANVPVLSIFGPTDFIINRPYSRNSVIIRKEMSCSPCKKKDCRTRECLMTISSDEVFKALRKIPLRNEV
ncbi:MAG: glycosyltransferase family 9 protein [Syntrophorhabdaceae bacterium]|nr:glycosyltransferase family 9 protein [Syntrophorhabdaceae bacterium]